MFSNVFAAIAFGLLFVVCHAMTKNCTPGTFLSSGKCELCPPGTYQDKAGSNNCKPCPAGYFNPFQGAQGIDVCQACKGGTFSIVVGARNASVCRPCARGTDSLDGSSKCVSCPKAQVISRCPLAGSFDETIIPGQCTSCSQNFCVIQPADIKCRKCPDGSFSNQRNSKTCTRCDERFIAAPGSANCMKCPPGTGGLTFVDSDRFEKCGRCDSGNFNDGKLGVCRSCPPGFQGNSRVGATKCVACPPGRFGRPPLGGACVRCPEGQNVGVTAATACFPPNTPCPSNFFRNFRGACQKCTRRERYDRPKKTCVPCAFDEQSEGALATTCTKCPRGSVGFTDTAPFGVLQGDLGCVCEENLVPLPDGTCGPCPAGSVKEFPDSFECTPCRPGSVAPRPGMTKCINCPTGTVQVRPGQKKCVTCPKGLKPGATEGQFFPGIGSARCANPRTNCAPGERRTLLGQAGPFRVPFCLGREPLRPCTSDEFLFEDETQSSCAPCPTDQVGVNGTCVGCPGQSIRFNGKCRCVSGRELVDGKCRRCPKGSFGRRGVTGCTKCPAGTFLSSIFRLECKLCRVGTFSPAGASRCTPCPPGTITYGRGSANCVKPGSLKK